MKITIRQEQMENYKVTESLVKLAFENMEFSELN